jgi:2,3-bisphosphoglycerate-independent phosphoglycerate mutase
MKAAEITAATIEQMLAGRFDFGRINFANGDMVGHTGDIEASVIAVQTIDLMLRKLIRAAQRSNTVLLVTADHGNCDEMFEGKQEGWEQWESIQTPLSPKTSHTLSPVPLYLYDPAQLGAYRVRQGETLTLANIANTALVLLGMEPRELYRPSIIEVM